MFHQFELTHQFAEDDYVDLQAIGASLQAMLDKGVNFVLAKTPNEKALRNNTLPLELVCGVAVDYRVTESGISVFTRPHGRLGPNLVEHCTKTKGRLEPLFYNDEEWIAGVKALVVNCV